MPRPYAHLDVQRHGDVFCVRLRQSRLDEDGLYAMCAELISLLEDEGCRKMVLNLGPPEPEFLYSIFLAKMVSLQRRLRAVDGSLKLAGAGPNTLRIFEACRLQSLFDFVPDEDTARAQFGV